MKNNGQADRSILLDILEHCRDIQNALLRFGDDFSVFQTDVDYRKSVCLSLMQVGELSGNLSETFRAGTGDRMPWPAIKSMRNWIAHNYLHVKLEIIWNTVQEEIPEMVRFCCEMLETMPPEHIPEEELQL